MLTPVEVKPQRYRASYGRYLEDFTVGDVYEHRPGRTITESDNINFSLMTMNAHPMHCDAAFAAKSEFGKPLVNSGLPNSLFAAKAASQCIGCAFIVISEKLMLSASVMVRPGRCS